MLTEVLKRNWRMLAVLGAALFVFQPWRSAEFLLWDDDVHVADNPLLHPLNFEHFRQIWSHTYQSLFIPVTYTVWGAVAGFLQVFVAPDWAQQQDTSLFLFLNLALHLLNGFLVFKILERFTGRSHAVFWGTLVFLFHPLQVESVAGISGLKELLWVSFALASILSQSLQKIVWMFVFATLAMLSLPLAAVLPGVLLATYFLNPQQQRQKPFQALAPLVPLGIVAIVISVMTKIAQGNQFITVLRPLGFRLLMSLDTFGFYLGKILWPWPLSIDYGRTPSWLEGHLPSFELWLFVVFVVAVLGLYWRQRKSPAGCSKFWLLVLGGLPLLPVSGLIPFLQQNYSTVTDRYIYFSLFAVATAVSFLPWDRRYFKIIGSVVVLTWMGLSFRQTQFWTTNKSLFTQTLQVNPQSFMAENNLGILASKDKQDEEAITHFERSFAINPMNISAATNKGILLTKLGRNEEALRFYQELNFQDPNQLKVHQDYGLLLSHLNRREEALAEFEKALRLAPENINALLDVGVILCQLSRCSEALPYFTKADELRPGDPAIKDYVQFAQKNSAH